VGGGNNAPVIGAERDRKEKIKEDSQGKGWSRVIVYGSKDSAPHEPAREKNKKKPPVGILTLGRERVWKS